MDSTSKTPFLSVVLPTLNEEETIAPCIEKINQVFSDLAIEGEIIVADSSTDKTTEIADSLGAILVRPDKKGYGNAYIAGLLQTKGELIAIGDADNTYDFLELPKLLKRMDETGADLVFGSRLKGTIKPGAMPWLHQYIGNPLLTWILNHLFHTHISDAHSGFRLIRREALEQLPLTTGGMEFASEMFIEAARRRMKIEEVPISYSPRIAPSKLMSFTDGWRHMRFMLLYRPIPFIAIPGLLFAGIGILMMLILYFSGGVESSHLHSFIVVAFVFIGGLQLLFTGIHIKVYSTIHGYSAEDGVFQRLLTYHNLEYELVIGIILILAGLVIWGSIIWNWGITQFGELTQIVEVIWAMTLLIAGLDVVFSAIFLSVMLLNADSGGE